MRIMVQVFAVEYDGGSPRLEADGVSLASCFPDFPHDPEYETIRDQLRRRGDMAFTGGGAAPLFKIVRVNGIPA